MLQHSYTKGARGKYPITAAVKNREALRPRGDTSASARPCVDPIPPLELSSQKDATRHHRSLRERYGRPAALHLEHQACRPRSHLEHLYQSWRRRFAVHDWAWRSRARTPERAGCAHPNTPSMSALLRSNTQDMLTQESTEKATPTRTNPLCSAAT